jgi:uncharacterized protein YkwD
VISLTNAQRTAQGLSPLSSNTLLQQAAQGHGNDMAVNDYFSHTGLNGSTPSSRVNATGYAWSALGENIAAGYTTPEAVVTGWMNSSGHRANILNSNFQQIGVGYCYLATDTGSVNYRYYWVQVFARPR